MKSIKTGRAVHSNTSDKPELVQQLSRVWSPLLRRQRDPLRHGLLGLLEHERAACLARGEAVDTAREKRRDDSAAEQNARNDCAQPGAYRAQLKDAKESLHQNAGEHEGRQQARRLAQLLPGDESRQGARRLRVRHGPA